MKKPTTREGWMTEVARHMAPAFKRCGVPLPAKIRITVSLTRNRRHVGVCYSPAASKDGHHEILVRIDRDSSLEVAGILCHELAHAAVGLEHGHKAPFQRAVYALGLMGKATATIPGPAFIEWVSPILLKVGPFPHAALDTEAGERSGPKKQTGRMLKVQCDECGLVARMAAKWIDEVGPVHCPDHGEMAVDGLDQAEEDAA